VYKRQVLIGENGSGKSSVLSATLKALLVNNYRRIRFKETEITNKKEKTFARVTIEFWDNIEPYVVDIQKGGAINYSNRNSPFINSVIIGFGPFKHSRENNKKSKDFVGGAFVDNFFDPSISLRSSKEFLLKLTNEQFEFVATSILDLLMLKGKAKVHRNLILGKLWIVKNGSESKFFIDELSDGFQSVINLGCNIMEGLLRNNEKIELANGFVVIDEIGANLHPRWQMRIIKSLREAFPKVQFLVSTHEPLCLKGLEEKETYVLTNENGNTKVFNDLPNPSYMRSDQLLNSEFFGLYSTVDPETEELFEKYYELLVIDENKKQSEYPPEQLHLKCSREQLM
jgi:predicted ATP-binding protein involved in virulence